ncbi:hypothetical protein EZV73_03305 [Acidaminobacter sp. JC074]|uniref:hypothetical protein n=1 Tax=Acidaminobacter sp. JC074 TaxID=2530199 RepID=UPI001F0DB2F2|nr:hypothetical protein [Acidaminobacter sp. JC074]MCH4886577.1 hypothetical protein [Acidaminobacter sp. JC074]
MYMGTEYRTGHYSYYKNIKTMTCGFCGQEVDHYLLRFRTFLIPSLHLFATNNRYYTICSNCSDAKEVKEEFEIMKMLDRIDGRKPVKYNGSQTLMDRIDDHVRTTEESFQAAIIFHMKDMKKSQ